MTQLGLFDGQEDFHLLDKPIRLISLFSGYDSQALALKYLNIPFEHYKTCEWAINSIYALYDLHFNDIEHRQESLLPYDELCKFYADKISKDYSTPLTYKQVCKLGEEKLREIDFCANNSNNLLNICYVKGKDLEIVDTEHYNYLLTYSFPCFVGDSLVLTDKGYKEIKDIKVGDYVLTHDNSYRRVVNVYDNGKHDIMRLQTMGADEIKATPNHKFYVRQMYRYNGKRLFKDPEWKELKDLDKSYYVGTPINQNSIIPQWNGTDLIWKDGRKARHSNILESLMNNPNWWYIVGRYIADGWIRTQGGIIICSNPNKLDSLLKALDECKLHYYIVSERTTTKVHIVYKDVEHFFLQFNRGAKNKELTHTILDLPIDLLKSFLDGYWYADGCIIGKVYSATSISRNLIYGLGECIAKVYHRPYSVNKFIRPKTAGIEGRTIHQNDTYTIRFKLDHDKQDKAFYENDHLWTPITRVEDCGQDEVFDIEVEDNHSFTIQNVIVHNCQDLSLSGNRGGMSEDSGTRSSLLWEVGRLLTECDEKPQVLLMENVPQVLEKTNIKEFGKWIDKLESLGYKSYFKVLNAKDYGVPQNRARCYMVSLYGDYKYYFPEPLNKKVQLKDVLEKEVDEKYFISKDTLHTSLTTPYWSNTLGERLPRDEDGLAHTIKASADNEKNADLVAFDKDGQLYDSMEDKDNLIGQFENHRKWHKKQNELIPFGTYFTWKDKQGNINTQCNRACNPENISLTVPTEPLTKVVVSKDEDYIYQNYRIRKLTPMECFRLMGVKDEDYHKIAVRQTEKALYHMAGDSIVVNVLMEIFKELL